jgi:hypothetical protein
MLPTLNFRRASGRHRGRLEVAEDDEIFAVAKPSARENFGGILGNDMARRSERLKGLFE